MMSDMKDIPDVADLTIDRIRRDLEDREFTCVELCEASSSSGLPILTRRDR